MGITKYRITYNKYIDDTPYRVEKYTRKFCIWKWREEGCYEYYNDCDHGWFPYGFETKIEVKEYIRKKIRRQLAQSGWIPICPK